MKGSPKLPSCGFSAQAVQALSACGERFAYVDILQNPDIRAELPKYANWPTFPQLWVDGELVGGCDIVIEMYQRGELQQLIKETAAKYKTDEPKASNSAANKKATSVKSLFLSLTLRPRVMASRPDASSG
jgi:monothiol glutaredoxin